MHRNTNQKVPPAKTADQTPSIPLSKKPFRDLFDRDELILYASGALVYILLGMLLLNFVLNFVVGPLFIVAWIWLVPSLIAKLRDNKQ